MRIENSELRIADRTALFGGEGFEAFTHDLGTVDDVDKGSGVEVAEVGTEFDEVGTLHGDVA